MSIVRPDEATRAMTIGVPVRIAALSPVPWKNGGGITRNLAVEPEGAGFDDFLWRVSFAEVNARGRFSSFPGVDRSILLWRGNGLLLHTKDGGVVALSEDSDAYVFGGEEEIEAGLVDGPVTDLNVMVRRGVCSAVVRRYEGETTVLVTRQAFFICARGGFRLRFPLDQGRVLNAGEALAVSGVAEGVEVLPDTTGGSMIVVLIDVQPAAAATD